MERCYYVQCVRVCVCAHTYNPITHTNILPNPLPVLCPSLNHNLNKPHPTKRSRVGDIIKRGIKGELLLSLFKDLRTLSHG